MDIQEFFCKLREIIKTIDGMDDQCEITNLEEAKCAVNRAFEVIQEAE